MKKTTLSALLLVLCLGLAGCEICADCTCISTAYVPGSQPVVTTTVDEVCGRKEINDRRGWSTVKSSVGGQTVTVNTSCDCK